MSLSSHKQTLFGGAVDTLVSDRSAGVIHPAHPDFSKRIAELQSASGAQIILAQSLAMKTDIADMRTGDPLDVTTVPGFVRTKNKADAVIISGDGITVDVTPEQTALLLMVGDSPGVIVHDVRNEALALINASLECLDPADGSDGLVKKLIDRLLATGSNPHDIRVAVSAAAQACCYGHDLSQGAQNQARLSRLTSRYGNDVVTPSITYPPRTGNGINLGLIAQRQAEAAGIRPEDCTIDPLCTSHDGLDTSSIAADVAAGTVEQGRFFSHVRGATVGAKQQPPVGWNGRGALLAWTTTRS